MASLATLMLSGNGVSRPADDPHENACDSLELDT